MHWILTTGSSLECLKVRLSCDDKSGPSSIISEVVVKHKVKKTWVNKGHQWMNWLRGLSTTSTPIFTPDTAAISTLTFWSFIFHCERSISLGVWDGLYVIGHYRLISSTSRPADVQVQVFALCKKSLKFMALGEPMCRCYCPKFVRLVMRIHWG